MIHEIFANDYDSDACRRDILLSARINQTEFADVDYFAEYIGRHIADEHRG